MAPAPDRAADHFYRGQDVVCAADRRQSELDRPFATRRDGAVETKPQRRLIAGQRQFDRLAGQRRGFAIEQHLGRPSGPVRGAARPAARIAGLALRKRPSPAPFSCFCCFLQRNISHRSISLTTRRRPSALPRAT
jgi:hypothetical protein